MKLKVQLIIESDSGEAEVMHEVAKLERPSLRSANLGLMLSEAKELLQVLSGMRGIRSHKGKHQNRVADALRQVAT